jgi:Arc/MetJ-type ribon-helix-helix transcriptional regulator
MVGEEGAAAMTIEIHKPELEALIQERMKSGGFQSVDDVLMEALKSAPPTTEQSRQAATHTGADLVAAMQASPYKEVDLEPAGARLPVRGVTF